MILVQITAQGIKEVSVESNSEEAQDIDLLVWRIVRKELRRLDRKLKRAARKREVTDHAD